ncbi:hypothetical protein SOVF_130080 [Spinacia oleracea]|nr:hypothetical protein SOVF_130080 [Spinacia oleracea]
MGRLAMRHDNITKTLNCKVLAIKQPIRPSSSSSSASANQTSYTKSNNTACITQLQASLTLDFSQIEVAPLLVPNISPQKIPYQICPDPSAIIWRSKKNRRRSRRNS